jgi:hypothetical protein
MKFIVGATITISGHMEIEAPDMATAITMCEKLNVEGVDSDQLEDTDTSSEVFIDELVEMKPQ